MAVIINDFEVIMEPPKSTENPEPTTQSATAPGLRPDDIVRVQRYHEQRKLRLLAD